MVTLAVFQLHLALFSKMSLICIIHREKNGADINRAQSSTNNFLIKVGSKTVHTHSLIAHQFNKHQKLSNYPLKTKKK